MTRRGVIRVIKDRLGKYKLFESTISTEGLAKGIAVNSLREAHDFLKHCGVEVMPTITGEWTTVEAPSISDTAFMLYRR